MNGAQAAVEALRREGTEYVFGLPGTTIMHLIDALGQLHDMRYISVRHEQVAAFMADGYARADGGRAGVCMASRGPGAANLAIGIHNAHAESVPVVAVIGQVPDQVYYRGAFEELDLVRFFEPITKWSAEIHRPERIPELIQRAVRTALSGRPGPVMVSLPLDVQTADADACYQPRFRPARPAPQEPDIEQAAGLLAAARRPVLVAGGGFRGPGYDQGLIKLADRLQLPVVTTWLRKNVFPNDSPLFCGSLGYGAVPVTEDLVREADVVLAIGCRFSELATRQWTLFPAGATLIHVDIDPEVLGRTYVPAIGICADAGTAAAALLAAAAAGKLPAARLAGRRRRAARARQLPAADPAASDQQQLLIRQHPRPAEDQAWRPLSRRLLRQPGFRWLCPPAGRARRAGGDRRRARAGPGPGAGQRPAHGRGLRAGPPRRTARRSHPAGCGCGEPRVSGNALPGPSRSWQSAAVDGFRSGTITQRVQTAEGGIEIVVVQVNVVPVGPTDEMKLVARAAFETVNPHPMNMGPREIARLLRLMADRMDGLED